MSKKRFGFCVASGALVVAVAIEVAWNSRFGRISATAEAALQELADQAAEPLTAPRWLDSHIALGPAMSRRREAFSRIERYGPKSIPVLLTLSEHPDRDVSEQARSSLRNISKQLDPVDESAMLFLLVVLDKGGRPPVVAWSRHALLDIGSGQAGLNAAMVPLSEATLRADMVLELAEAEWISEDRRGLSARPWELVEDIAAQSRKSPRSSAARTRDVGLLFQQIIGAKSLLSDSSRTSERSDVNALVQQIDEGGRGSGMALQGLARIAEGNASVAGLDLGMLTPDFSVAIPALIQMAERNSTLAIKTLGLIGPDAHDAVPVLLAKLEPSKLGVGSFESATALGLIGVKDRSVVSALVGSLDADLIDGSRSNSNRNRRPWTTPDQSAFRKSVAKSLGQLAAHADLSVPALIALMDFYYIGGSEGQNLAIEAVMAFGTEAREAIPKLTELLANSYTMQKANAALHAIDPDSSGTTKYLAAQLSSQETLAQIRAAKALGILGLDARSAIPALLDIADSSDDELVASWSAYALWKIDPASLDPGRAVPALVSVLEGPAYPFASKRSALADLGAMGPAAKSALPAISRMRRDYENNTLLPAITETEIKIGPRRPNNTGTSSSESESSNAEPMQDLEILQAIVGSIPDHRHSSLEAEYDAAGNLVRLSLVGATLEQSRVDQLRSLDHLKELDLSSCRLPESMSRFTIAKITSLEDLNLNGCRSVSDADLTHLAKLPNLQSLQLGRTAVTFKGLEAFENERPGVVDPVSLDAIRFSQLKEFKHLGLKGELERGLKLKSLKLTARSARPEVLGQILVKCESLQSLTLRSATITDEGLKLLRHCPKLEALDLTRVKGITPAGAASIAELGNLRTLVLESTDVGDDEVIQFARLNHLESLNLGSCTRVTDTGIFALADLQEMRELRLFRCRKLTSTIIPVLEGFPNLEFLNVGACSFSQQEREQIRRKLPDCKIQF